jgi:hypothetical protein
MQRAMINPDEPDLCVRIARKQPVGSSQGIPGYLECTAFDIDGDDLAAVTLFHLRPYVSFIDFLAAPGRFFFAITRLTRSHGAFPVHTESKDNHLLPL